MTLEQTRKYFEEDKFATKITGITIEEAEPGYSVCELQLTDNHRNAAGAVMGGAIFTLCDFSFAVATNYEEGKYTTTSVSQISFLSATKGDVLRACTRTIKDGKRSCFCETEVKDNLGNLIAVATSQGMHL